MAQVRGLGPMVGGRLALLCIPRVNRVYGALVVTLWTCYGTVWIVVSLWLWYYYYSILLTSATYIDSLFTWQFAMRVCGMLCFRLDTAGTKMSPHNTPSTSTTATTTVDKRIPGSRDRSSSARRTSSPAKCPSLGKSSPASGKSSPAASPLTDSSRRRRAADHRNSPRHTANSPRHASSSSAGGLNSTAGGLGSEVGTRAGRYSVQSSSSSVINSRLKPVAVVEHPAIHSGSHPAVQAGGSGSRLKLRSEEHSAIHSGSHPTVPAEGPGSQLKLRLEEHPAIHSGICPAVLAGGSGSQLKLRSDKQNAGDTNGNRRQPRSDPASNTTSVTNAHVIATSAAYDDIQRHCEHCREQSRTSTDTGCTSQVCTKSYAQFYQLGITQETRVIPGISNSSILSTPNLGLFSE